MFYNPSHSATNTAFIESGIVQNAFTAIMGGLLSVSAEQLGLRCGTEESDSVVRQDADAG